MAEPTPAPEPPIHPGLALAVAVDALKRQGWTVETLAAQLGISRQQLRLILHGHAPITAPTAARLDRLLGHGEAWLCQQARYDLWAVEARLGNELAAIPDLSTTPLAA